MKRLNIPGAVRDLARRAYQDALEQLDTDDQVELLETLCEQGLQRYLRQDEDRPKDPREAAHYDAQTLVAAARQLEFALTEVYQEEFPDLPVANGEIIDFETGIPQGAQSFFYYVYSSAALARFTAAYATGEAPRASLKGAQVQGRVEAIEGSYGWHIRELRAAQYAGIPIETWLAVAEREAHLRKAQDTFIYGREDLGLPGLFTHPNITVMDAPADGTAGSRLWSAKTFSLIARDISLLVRTVERISFGKRKTTHVLLPREEMIRLESTFLDTGNATNLTLLEAIKKLHPRVEFRELNECSASFSDGRLATDCAVAYVKDRRILRAVYPMQYLQHPPEVHMLETTIVAESSVGGIILVEPQTVIRMDGIGQS